MTSHSRETAIRKLRVRTTIFVLLPLFVLAHFSHHLVAALITPLLPFIRESFALDYTHSGILVSAFNLAYGAGQLPAGWLADRIGSPALITIGISGVALCGLLVGLSLNFIMMAVFLILMGIIGGGYHPSASPLISTAVDQKHRGQALGIHQIGGTASFFLAPLIAVGIAKALGWRGSFISLSVPTFIYGMCLFILLKSWKYGKATFPLKSGSKGTIENNTVSIPSLVPVMLLNIVTQILIFSTLSFIPFYVVDNYGGSKEVAAALLSLAHSAGLWAGPLGGYLSDRLGKVPIILFTGIVAGPLIYLLNRVSLGWSISIILLLLGMAQYMGMPVTEAYIISHTSDRNRSTMLGVYYFISRGGPGLITPALGYLIDKFHFQTAFTSTGVIMGIVALTCISIILGYKDWRR